MIKKTIQYCILLLCAFVLFINKIYCQNIPNIINLINVSSNKINFEKFMINNNFVLTVLENQIKTYSYDCLVCDPDGHLSDIRPSLDSKYETKYFSTDFPFLGKSLTLSQYIKLTGYSEEQAIDSLNFNEHITTVKFSEKVHYEPTLDLNSCYSWEGSDHEYGWEFDEDTKQAAIWVYRTARIFSDCSDNEKISTVSVSVEINVFDNRLFDQVIKNISSKSLFVENTKTSEGRLAQKYNYLNTQDKRKYVILITKSLDSGGGTIKIFWDSNPKSDHSYNHLGY